VHNLVELVWRSIKSLNRAAVLDGLAIAAQAAMARTNMDLFIASPLEFARLRL
jgi:hypothetical protein